MKLKKTISVSLLLVLLAATSFWGLYVLPTTLSDDFIFTDMIEGAVLGLLVGRFLLYKEKTNPDPMFTYSKMFEVFQNAAWLMLLSGWFTKNFLLCAIDLGYLCGYIASRTMFDIPSLLWSYTYIRLLSKKDKDWAIRNEDMLRAEDTQFTSVQKTSTHLMYGLYQVRVRNILYDRATFLMLFLIPNKEGRRAYRNMVRKLYRCTEERNIAIRFKCTCTINGKMTACGQDNFNQLQENFLLKWNFEI